MNMLVLLLSNLIWAMLLALSEWLHRRDQREMIDRLLETNGIRRLNDIKLPEKPANQESKERKVIDRISFKVRG